MDRDALKLRVKEAVDLAEFIGREVALKKVGETEWTGLCPFHPDKSPSFTVFRKDGSWRFHCFGCDAGGDVFEWIMRRHSVAFPQALTQAANYVGLASEDLAQRLYQPPQPKAAERPHGMALPEKFRALTETSAAFRYLTETRRLPAHLLADYSVGETLDGLAYAFKYQWRPGNRPPATHKPVSEFYKVVNVARPEGRKVERREPRGGRNILFGMCAPIVEQAAAAGGELVICEGEIDAVTWAVYGFAAVSVPCGAKYTGWIDVCWDWLQQFRKIHISFDEDEAGRMKVVEIVTRLGMARTDIIRLPRKPEVAA
jgi:DNA primase